MPGERWWRVLFLALASVSFLISLILLFLSAPVPIRADCVDAGAEEVEERVVGLRERQREAMAWRRSADRRR